VFDRTTVATGGTCLQSGKGQRGSTPEMAARCKGEGKSTATETASSFSANEKTALKLAKKLREIVVLEEQAKDGHKLQLNQQQKIASKDSVKEEFFVVLELLPPVSEVVARVQDLVSDLVNLKRFDEPPPTTPSERKHFHGQG